MSQNIRKYAMKQGIITCVCTIILCCVIFFMMIKGETDLHAAFIDLSLTVGCTGLICTLLQLFLTKGPVKKGIVPPVGNLEIQASYVFVSKSIVAFLIYFTLIELLLFSFAPYGIISFLGMSVLPKTGYIALKALMAGLAAGMGTYHANIFICGIHQEKMSTETVSQ